MRLSTAADRDEARARAVLAAALDAGVTLLDTARAYGLDDADLGHNERLVGEAVRGRPDVMVVTKGGMARPAGQWLPDGRKKRLHADCEASLEALGRIDLYLLHAPDPRTPLATSVRALGELRSRGLVRAVGLCNVGAAQIEEACAITEIAAVQVSLSPFDDKSLWGGVVDLCARRDIFLVAHSPLGGPRSRRRLEQDEVLRAVAARSGATPAEVALAWLRHLGAVPVPGATRIETARSIARAAELVLADADLRALEARSPAAARRPAHRPAGDGEVVLLMGIPGAGKSRLAESWVARGHERLNRDARGGRLAALASELDAGLGAGRSRWVADNTFATRASRAPFVAAAARHGVPVRCIWARTPLAEAQVNAVRRLLRRYGRLPGAEELRKLQKTDPHAFDPRAQHRFERELEPPADDEGFAAIEVLDFRREPEPTRPGRGLIVQLEGIVRSSRTGERAPTSPDDVVLVEGAAAALRGRHEGGWRLFGFSWQPAVGEGRVEAAAVEATMQRTRDLLGLELEVGYCPHVAGPPRCWCRTPLPGLVLCFLERAALDPAQCLLVGRPPADRTLAERVGMPFVEGDAFLGGGSAASG
jgi:aryl-alcohol dehydrogenase-like predicted oxidoreductase/histidinol phosphatase-like enzyme